MALNRKHRVGGLDFDSDMSLIESFIAARERPDNLLLQTEIHTYYVYRVMAYWNAAKHYLTIEYEVDYNAAYPAPYWVQIERPYSTADLEHFEQFVLSQIDAANAKFQEERLPDIALFGRLFQFMTEKVCRYKESRASSARYPALAEEYPLPNESGLFGFNTYLYAMFNGIFLIGIPNKLSRFDDEIGCPAEFRTHDLGHSYFIRSILKIGGIAWNATIKLYYRIIKDPKLTPRQRQCHLLMLWIHIHEFQWSYYGVKFNLDNSECYESILNNSQQRLDVRRFRDYYVGFIDLIGSDDNLLSLIAMPYFTSAFNWNWQLLLYPKDEFETEPAEMELPPSLDVARIPTESLYILAAWYHVRYITEYRKTLSPSLVAAIDME